MKKTNREAAKSAKKPAKRSPPPTLATITPALHALAVSIDSLTPDPRNARVHDRRNLDAIRASLSKFGQQKPISVDADGIVLAGNGTLTAARELGWTHIAVARSELRGAAARAFAIADNRSAELATWDARELNEQLAEITDADIGIELDDLAFTDVELDALLADPAGTKEGPDAIGRPTRNFEPAPAEAQQRLDQRKPVTCPNCQTEFVPGKRDA